MYNQVENNFRPAGVDDRTTQSGQPGRLDHIDRIGLLREGNNQWRSNNSGEPSSLDLNSPIGGENANPLGRIDTNHDRVITREESNQAYRDFAYRDGVKDIKADEFAQAFGTGEKQQELFKAMDANGDGKVGHGEWLRHFKGAGFEDYKYANNDGVLNEAQNGAAPTDSGAPAGGAPAGDQGGKEGAPGGDKGGHAGGASKDNPQGEIPPELMQLMQKLGLSPKEFYEKFAYQDGKKGFTLDEMTKAFGGDSAAAAKVMKFLDTNGDGRAGYGGWLHIMKGVNVPGSDAGGDQGGGHY